MKKMPDLRLFITATFFGGLAKTTIHFLINKTLDNTANFSWPIGDRINGVPLYIVVLLKLNYVL